MAIKVLGVCGSMREGSYSTRAVKVALDFAKEYGAETQILDLREVDLPMYKSPSSIGSEQVSQAANMTEWADLILLSSPDYHGSMSGALKNYLDYHWEEFAGKLFGYICASHEKGLTVMEQMRTAVRQCYGWSLPYGVAFDGKEVFDATCKITNPRTAQRLKMMVRDLIIYGDLIRTQFKQDLSDNISETFAARYK